nr:hypothetical protein [Marinobacter koreensis]
MVSCTRILALLSCWALVGWPAAGSADPSRYVAPETHGYVLWYRNYDSSAIRALVTLALKKTPEYGPFRLIRSEELSQGRALRELADDHTRLVDIVNVATSQERETQLTAIPIPIDGGLLGLRVCVVTPDKLPLFQGIRTLDDIRKRNIRIGQGAHWPDTQILRGNGISVVTHSRYEILFGMLRNDRFDCFARGVSEVLYDLGIERDPNLVVEPNLLLAYPMPSYLFVGPRQHEIAQRLQLGLERAIEDGSFGNYLATYYGTAVEALRLRQRTVIRLQNPDLTEESRLIGRKTFRNLKRRLDFLSSH